MAPDIGQSSYRRGITYWDVQLVLDDPVWVETLSDIAAARGWTGPAAERPNVVVYGGYDLRGRRLVVFVDRYEDRAFHSQTADAFTYLY